MKQFEELRIRRIGPGRVEVTIPGRGDIYITGYPVDVAQSLFFAIRGIVESCDKSEGGTNDTID